MSRAGTGLRVAVTRTVRSLFPRARHIFAANETMIAERAATRKAGRK